VIADIARDRKEKITAEALRRGEQDRKVGLYDRFYRAGEGACGPQFELQE